MPILERQALCVNHAPARAVGACGHCGNAFCDDCLVEGLAVPEVYCSESCRVAAEPDGLVRFSEGLKSPFRTGLKLWASALPSLFRHSIPLAVAATVLLWLGFPALGASAEASPAAPAVLLGVVLIGVYGVLLTGTILTQHYTGLVRGNVYVWALGRLVPWVVAWFLVMVATSVGYLALVVPGIILALRLFWADEFVVAHRLGPVEALKQSWEVTRGALAEVFLFQLLAGAFGWLIFMAGFLGTVAFGALTPLVGLSESPLMAFVSSLVFFVGYGALHGPELAKFYGMRARQLHDEPSVVLNEVEGK